MSMHLNWKNKADDEETEAEEIVVGIEAALEALEALEEIEAEAEEIVVGIEAALEALEEIEAEAALEE
jgi:hypothetical protein